MLNLWEFGSVVMCLPARLMGWVKMLSRSAVAPMAQSSELPHFSRHEVKILRKSQRLRLGAVLFVLRLHM